MFVGATIRFYSTILLLSVTLGMTGPAINAEDATPGTLILIGGVLSLKQRVVWTRISELAGGEVVVIPAANERSRLYGNYAVRGLTRSGLFARLLPVAVSPDEFNSHYRQASRSPDLVEQVRDADAVFFVGGAPQRLAKVLFNEDGSATPLAAAIEQVYADGGIIIGGIPGLAGAHTGMDALYVLQQGQLPEQQLYRGLGLIDEDWYVDQHFFVAGRFAETLVTMHQRSVDFGIGVGPNAAAVIRDDELEVIGEAGLVIVDLSRATSAVDDAGFNLKGVRLSYLGDGDRVDMRTARISPHSSKLDGFEIHPSPDGQEAVRENSLVVDDVLAGDHLVQLLVAALDGEGNQSTGLAFHQRRERRAGGFRFRFYAASDTAGWLSVGSGGERYTALNVYLDVTPLSGERAFGLL